MNVELDIIYSLSNVKRMKVPRFELIFTSLYLNSAYLGQIQIIYSVNIIPYYNPRDDGFLLLMTMSDRIAT